MSFSSLLINCLIKISGSESFTRWLVGYESKYESIQSFRMGEYESTALKELHSFSQ